MNRHKRILPSSLKYVFSRSLSLLFFQLLVNQPHQVLITFLRYLDNPGTLTHHLTLFEPALCLNIVPDGVPLSLLNIQVLAPLIKNSTDFVL